MDVSTTSNPFIMLAEAGSRRGEDMEEVARALAKAFKAVASVGIGKTDNASLTAEFCRLAFPDECQN